MHNVLHRLRYILFASIASFISVPLFAQLVPAPLVDAKASDTWDGSIFQIEDSKTRVSIASVKLSVSDLKPEGDKLVGEYTIKVPLMESKNDQGKIVLPLDRTMQEIENEGGILRGQAISYKVDKTPKAIVCEILPEQDQKILLQITTLDRILKFESKYSIIETSEDS